MNISLRSFYLFFMLIFWIGSSAMPSLDSTTVETVKADAPLRIGIAGLSHSHVHWILGRPDRGDIEIVGIAEPDHNLAMRLIRQYKMDSSLLYPSLEAMLEATKPEAVTAFGSIFEHLEVVEKCAPRGIHVMVEKPLAVSMAHARKMERLASEYSIHLLTNYETTWYASHHRAYEMIKEEKAVGPLRKIVVHDGHEGPKKIGVNKEFMDWLGDPVLNGGGALTDFGCYGANLTTWLMDGQRPTSVMAMTQHFQPEDYPEVDDEATIIVTYPETQSIIQASWNWPFSRKDLEVYGLSGYIYCDNRSDIRFRLEKNAEPGHKKLAERPAPYDDPFSYLAGVIRGTIKPPPFALSSLENNLIVVEILDAARKSARKGKVVKLKGK